MKILVTGGAGFIGSNIVDRYVSGGHRVWVIDDLSSGKKKNVNPRARLLRCDIRSGAAARLIAREKFDVINHHAAQIDVRRSVQDPRRDADINILGLINVLQAGAAAKTRKVIFSSSGGTIYGECGARRPREESSAMPLSPYGISKLSSEYYIKYFGAMYGMRYTILRYGNVFGPRQDPHGEAGVVAIFCSKFIACEPITIFGDGRQMRDYVFVADVADANVRALTRAHNEIVNIGTGAASSVNDLYQAMKSAGRFSSPALYKPARPGELFKSFLDARKASRVLGWKPRYSLSLGLRETINYFKKEIAG